MTKNVINDGRLLILAVVAYYVITLLFSQLTSTNLKEYYDNLSNFPLGSFSALFLYDGYTNIISFGLAIFLFAIGNYRYAERTVEVLSIYSIIFMFLIGFLANVYWAFEYPSLNTLGQSGVAYALNGIVFMFCVYNIGPLVEDYKKGFRNLKGEAYDNLFASLLSFLMALVILFYLILDKGIFLSEAPGIAFPIHAFSFFLGVVITAFFDFLLSFNEKKKRRLSIN